MNHPVVRTQVHKCTPLHFLVDGLQVWVSYLDENENGPFGVMVKWLEHEHSVSPLEHITEDGGHSYQQVESYLLFDGGVEKRKTTLETDAGKLDRLQRIWVVYQQKLGEGVFSV